MAAVRTHSTRRHFVELHIAVVLFGAAGLFGKLVELTPGPLVLGRATVGAVFVIAIGRVAGDSMVARSRRDLAVFAVQGVILAVHWIAFFRAVQVSSVSVAVVALSTFPIFTAILAPLARGERPPIVDLGLALVALAGVALIVPTLSFDSADTRGAAWGVTAAGLFAVLTVINERLVGDYSSRAVAVHQFAVAAVVLAPLYAVPLVADARAVDWLLLLLLGTLFTGVAHTLLIASMRGIRAQTASLTVGLEPVYAVFLAWIILDERPGWRTLLGGVVVLTAVVVGTSRTGGAADP